MQQSARVSYWHWHRNKFEFQTISALIINTHGLHCTQSSSGLLDVVVYMTAVAGLWEPVKQVAGGRDNGECDKWYQGTCSTWFVPVRVLNLRIIITTHPVAVGPVGLFGIVIPDRSAQRRVTRLINIPPDKRLYITYVCTIYYITLRLFKGGGAYATRTAYFDGAGCVEGRVYACPRTEGLLYTCILHCGRGGDERKDLNAPGTATMTVR